MIRFYCCFYQAVKKNFGKSEIKRSAQIRHPERVARMSAAGRKADVAIVGMAVRSCAAADLGPLPKIA